MVLAGDSVHAGTTLVTPVLECQSPRTNPKDPAECTAPAIENFLATVLI